MLAHEEQAVRLVIGFNALACKMLIVSSMPMLGFQKYWLLGHLRYVNIILILTYYIYVVLLFYSGYSLEYFFLILQFVNNFIFVTSGYSLSYLVIISGVSRLVRESV